MFIGPPCQYFVTLQTQKNFTFCVIFLGTKINFVGFIVVCWWGILINVFPAILLLLLLFEVSFLTEWLSINLYYTYMCSVDSTCFLISGPSLLTSTWQSVHVFPSTQARLIAFSTYFLLLLLFEVSFLTEWLSINLYYTYMCSVDLTCF